MLYVIVGILKWIGIVLLALLALLLTVLLLVLFLPVRYRFQAEYQENLNGTGWVRWLYPVLEVRLQVEKNKPQTQIRIFGRSLEAWKKSLGAGKKRKQKRNGKKKETEGGQTPEYSQKLEEGQLTGSGQEPGIGQVSDHEKKYSVDVVAEKFEKDKDDQTPESDQMPESGQQKALELEENQEARIEASDDTTEEKSGNSAPLSRWERFLQAGKAFFTSVRAWFLGLWNRLKAIWEKVTGFRQKLVEFWEKGKALQEKVRGLWGKWEQIQEILQQESTGEALRLIWQECKKLLLALKPKKYELWIRYGTGDAYTLAQHLRILAIVYGLGSGHITIEPDWEEKVLLAKGSVKGRIRLFTLARICIKVITDKNVKRLWKQVSEWERS